MKMKKTRAVCLLVVFTMIVGCLGGITTNSTESKAASIYFAGEYKCENSSDCYFDLTINKYSTGGKISFIVCVVEERIGDGCAGNLTKVSSNTYRYKEGNMTLTFKVYANKIEIKQKGKTDYVGADFSGTYNLKKRYAKKAATKNISVYTNFQRMGKVTKISTNCAYYKTQISSSPLRYDKTRKIAFTSNTKFYKCKGIRKNSYKAQCVSKSTAIKAIRNTSRNYVYFKVKNGKATTVLYGMENYCG